MSNFSNQDHDRQDQRKEEEGNPLPPETGNKNSLSFEAPKTPSSEENVFKTPPQKKEERMSQNISNPPITPPSSKGKLQKKEEVKSFLKNIFSKTLASITPKKEEKETPKKETSQNVFTQVFQDEGGKNEGDIISNIIQTAKEERGEQTRVLGETFSDRMKEKEEEGKKKKKNKEEEKREKLLVVAQLCCVLALLIPLSSWVVFQTILNPESSFSETLSAKNYGKVLLGKEEEKKRKKEKIALLESEKKDIQDSIDKIKNNTILAQVTENRVDFLGIMLEITKTSFEALNLSTSINNVVQTLTFHSYAGDVRDGKVNISISGTVRDPKKKTLGKLTVLMEALNMQDNFEGASIRSFSKSEDNEFGGTQSSFSFKFQYLPLLPSEEGTLHAVSP